MLGMLQYVLISVTSMLYFKLSGTQLISSSGSG